jgi:hypothetical protein
MANFRFTDHPPRNGPKPFVVGGIAMFRQVLLGNGRALRLSCEHECQQNSPDDIEEDNIRKIPMNAVLPCLHRLDGHYRSMGQALARGEGNQGAVGGRLLAASSRKGPSAINQLKNIGSTSFFFSRSQLEWAKSLYSG